MMFLGKVLVSWAILRCRNIRIRMHFLNNKVRSWRKLFQWKITRVKTTKSEWKPKLERRSLHDCLIFGLDDIWTHFMISDSHCPNLKQCIYYGVLKYIGLFPSIITNAHESPNKLDVKENMHICCLVTKIYINIKL